MTISGFFVFSPGFVAPVRKARVVMLNPDMDIALVEFQPGEHKKFVDEVYSLTRE